MSSITTLTFLVEVLKYCALFFGTAAILTGTGLLILLMVDQAKHALYQRRRRQLREQKEADMLALSSQTFPNDMRKFTDEYQMTYNYVRGTDHR